MTDLKTEPAVLRMTLEITRAATGQKEVVEVIGTPITATEQEKHDERHTSHSIS